MRKYRLAGALFVLPLLSLLVVSFAVSASARTFAGSAMTAAAANPAANLDQCANDPAPSPSSDGCNSDATQWVNGNLGASKSLYFEGDSIPYRLTLSNLPVGTSHSVTIEWDTTKSDKHAIDYIDTFNQSVLNANPCLGVSGCDPNTFTPASIPADPQVTGAGVTPIAGSIRVYGGSGITLSRPSSVGNTACTDANSGGSYCYSAGTGFTGDKSAAITINFTADVTNPVIAWGGHIAARKDWGLTNSAVTIPGSPYHTRLIDLDGAGGNQDRSLSADAVVFPGFIHVIKNTTGGNATFPFTASPSPLADFSLTTVNGTAEKDFDNITNFQTYSVAEGTLPTNWVFDSATCTVASPNGGTQTVSGKTATIALKEGEEVTCTYANHFNANPHLKITKVATETGFSKVGDVIHYTITATNDGNVTLSNVLVTDPNVSNLSCGPSNPVASLAPGASITCTASHTITQADLDAGHFFNQACVDDGAGGAAQACSSVDTLGTANPHLSITKTFSPASYSKVGDVIHYTIVATNDGNLTLHNVTVTDPNGSGLTCTPAIPVANLSPGGTINCTASHTVTQADLDAGHYANQACVDDGAGGAAQACAPVDTPGTRNPHLSITKVATETGFSKVGDVIHYTIVATNDGNVTLSNVSVTDPNVSNLSCAPANPVASLAVGASINCTASHTITQADLDAGHFFNQACVDDGAGGAAQQCASVDTPGTANPHLSITKTDDLNPAKYDHVGQVITYTITAKNTGNVTVSNVNVTDDPALDGFSCTPANGSSLAPGDSMVCTGTHTITQADLDAGTFKDNACATSDNAAKACAPDTIHVKVTQPPATPGISIVKSPDSQTVASGGMASFSITVTNTGTVTLTNVQVTDVLSPNCNRTIGTLAPGASTSYTCTLTSVTAAFTNVATATGTPPSGPDVSASDTADVMVQAPGTPAISIIKNPKSQTVANGGTATFTITVTNTGAVTLTNVAVSDPLSPNCDRNIGTLTPGQSVSYTCTRPNVTSSFTNVATTTGTPPSGPNVTASDTAPVKASPLTPPKKPKKKPKVVSHAKPKATG